MAPACPQLSLLSRLGLATSAPQWVRPTGRLSAAEIAEGYPSNVMPQTYSQTMSKAEVHDLAEYLVATTPAKPNPEPK